MGLSTTYTKTETDFLIQQLEKKTSDKYNDESNSIANDIIKFIDINTGENVNYRETTTWHDGSVLDDEKIDGVIYKKINDKYYKRQYEGAIQLKWFGAVGDGVTDDTEAIQKAFDFGYINHNATFEIGHGIFNVTNTLYFPTRCGLKGSGMNESVFRMTNRTDVSTIDIREDKNAPNNISDPSLTNNTIYTKFSDFSIFGANWNGAVNTEAYEETSCGIFVSNMVKIDFERLTIRGFAGHGILIDKVYYIKLNNLFIEWNAISGLKVANSTSVQSVNCEFRVNGKGVILYQTYAWSFVNPLIESNVLSFRPAYEYGQSPYDRTSIGFLAFESWGGQISGGYFEDQLISIFLHYSYNIDVNGNFICNNSTWQQPPNYIPSYAIYFMGNGCHSNTIRNNSFLAYGTEVDVRMYFDVNTYGNTIEFNKKEHFDWLTQGQAWIWNEYKTNDILERSPKVICHESNEQFLYGKKIPLNGMYYGSSTERPAFATTGFQYLNTDTSKVEVKIGTSWIELN